MRTTAIILLALLGVSAVFGGWALTSSPTGDAIQLPIELLQGTPFDNYLIPGILLLVFNGFLSLSILWLTVKKRGNYPVWIIFQGAVLLIWLSVQLFMNADFYYPLLHVPYFGIALLLMVVGFGIAKGYSIREII